MEQDINLADELSQDEAAEVPADNFEEDATFENEASIHHEPVEEIPESGIEGEESGNEQQTTELPLTAKESARLAITMFDSVQGLLFSSILRLKRKSIFKKKGNEVVIAEQKRDKGEALSPDEANLLARLDAFDEKIEDMGLSDDEKDDIMPALEAYCKRNNVQVPVDLALGIAISKALIIRGIKVANA